MKTNAMKNRAMKNNSMKKSFTAMSRVTAALLMAGVISASGLLSAAEPAAQQDAAEQKQQSIMPALETLSKIAGTWEGVAQINGNPVPIAAVYKVTSAGNAVTEELTIGDQPMVSVYHKDGNAVAMTHYCAWGNKPEMSLTATASNKVTFDMLKPAGIQSEMEPHMRGVSLTLKDNGVLEQRWDISFAGGNRNTIVIE